MSPLLTYIESQLKLGTTREVITAQLLGQGWTRADIDRGFISLEVPLTPVTPVTPTIPVITATPLAPQQVQVKKSSTSSVITLIVLIIILLLIGGGVYFYFTFIAHNTPAQVADSSIFDSASTTSNDIGNTTVTVESTPINTSATNVVTPSASATSPVSTQKTASPAVVVSKSNTAGTARQSNPVITLRGQSKVVITQGDTYKDSGATAYDQVDGTISDNIVTTGLPIDTTKPGTYTITYSVTDSVGLSATKVYRIVSVLAPAYTKFGYKATLFPGITLTVSKPQPYSTTTPDYNDDSSYQPRPGYQYMVATATFDNQTSMDMPEQGQYMDTNYTDFHIVDANGNGYPVSATFVNNSSANPAALTGFHLLAYTQQTGTVIFEIPTSMPTTSDLKVVYQWSSDPTIKATFGN